MTQTLMSDTKKAPKRRINSTSKLSAEELARKILFVLIENLIPFEKVENILFRSFLNSAYCENSTFFPDGEVLAHLATEIYNDYQEYCRNYFEQQKDIRISISCHKWQPMEESQPYMFINAHYINSAYKLCELPLGLFSFKDSNLSNFLIRDTVLKNFKNKVSFITSNCLFEGKSLDVLKFVSNEENIESKIMPCIPATINKMLREAFEDLAQTISWEGSEYSDLKYVNSEREYIPYLVSNFLHPILARLSELQFAKLIPLTSDKDNERYEILLENSYHNDKANSLDILKSAVAYKSQVDELFVKCNQQGIGKEEWELIEFVLQFTRSFHEIIVASCSFATPVAHMVLKWIKILIIHVSKSNQNCILYGKKIDTPIMNILGKLNQLHSEIEGKFELVLSSYLHPSTKRYLKESHISKINSHVDLLSGDHGGEDGYESNSLDDIIMKMFDCSGKATKECYNYETSATSQITYSRSASYFAKESGSHILQFWKNNQSRYSTLSALSKEALSIQISTDQGFEEFKRSINEIKRCCYFNQSPCDLRAIYFLHRLSKVYNLQSFDPKNLDSNIEDYRIETGEYVDQGDTSSIFEEENMDGSNGIEMVKRLKK